MGVVHFRLVLSLALLLVTSVAWATELPLRDSRGIEFKYSIPVTRVVALAPHITELFYAAGAGNVLIGTVEYSNFPEAAKQLPIIGDSFRVDLEKISLMKPDLVAVWESGTPVALQEKLAELNIPVFSFETGDLLDVGNSLEQIGRLAGYEESARKAANRYRAAVRSLQDRYRDRERLSVFYQISTRPLYTVNGEHYISKLIESCGGTNIFRDLDVLAPSVAIESVIERNPDVIIAGRFPGMAEDLHERWLRFPGLAAVRNGNLYLVEAEIVARATPRLVQGMQAVCAVLDEARAKRST